MIDSRPPKKQSLKNSFIKIQRNKCESFSLRVYYDPENCVRISIANELGAREWERERKCVRASVTILYIWSIVKYVNK